MPPVAGFKNVLNKYFFAEFRVTITIFRGLATFHKETYKVRFWNWGPKTTWHNMASVQFFLSQITPTNCIVAAGGLGDSGELRSVEVKYTLSLNYTNY